MNAKTPSHWRDEELLGDRAVFRAGREPAELIINPVRVINSFIIINDCKLYGIWCRRLSAQAQSHTRVHTNTITNAHTQGERNTLCDGANNNHNFPCSSVGAFSPLQIHSFRFVFCVAVVVVICSPHVHIVEYGRTCCPQSYARVQSPTHIVWFGFLFFHFVSNWLRPNERICWWRRRCFFALCCICALWLILCTLVRPAISCDNDFWKWRTTKMKKNSFLANRTCWSYEPVGDWSIYWHISHCWVSVLSVCKNNNATNDGDGE